MATLYPHEKKNNLELYLNDVYEKECVFQNDKEKIEFIQTGIETLVQDLVDKILADDSMHKRITEVIDNSSLSRKMYNEKLITEVYFPIQSDSSLQRYVAKNASYVKTVKSTIIKVGSFYDGTKNDYPDEFDFIFPLLGVRSAVFIPFFYSINIEQKIHKHAEHMRYTFPSDKHEVTRKLQINKYIGRHGPAFKLQFIFSNGFGEQRHIYVDLVPAFRIVDSNTQQWFVEEVRKCVEPKTFREEILAAGSSLIVRENLAFTETEQHFMKNILSKKHVKVYRILKYLLNGHGDGEKFEEQFRHDPYYTSYRIKTLIIYHHEACTNTETENLGSCVLQVLEEMSKYGYTKVFPKFTRTNVIFVGKPRPLPCLKSTIETLQSLQTSEESYCYMYERDKIIKSVSGQYTWNTKTVRCCILL